MKKMGVVIAILFCAYSAHAQGGTADKLRPRTGAPPSVQCSVSAHVGKVWPRLDDGPANYVCLPDGLGGYAWSDQAGGGVGGATNFVDLLDVTGGVAWDLSGLVDGNTICADDIGGGVLNLVPCSTIWSGYIDLDAASCIAATATNNWNDSPTLTEPAAACASFTSTTVGLSDFDAAADEGYQLPAVLPGDWTGALDADFYWIAAATSGATAWGIQVGCAAADDPLSITFNTASVVSDTAMGTTNELNIASVTGITTTGCAANELMFVQVYRDANGTAATDDMTGDARLLKVRLKYRRSVVP